MKQGRTLQSLGEELKRQRSARKDFVADTRNLELVSNGQESVLSVFLENKKHVYPLNPLAHQQIATRLGIPYRYYQKMQEKDPSLLDDNVNALVGEPMKYRTIVMLGIDSGLRLGELMGLKWQDIDFEKATLSVTKANQALVGKGVFTKRPKNESSIRDVALSSSTLALLKIYQKEQMRTRLLLKEKWIDEGWVFTQWDGKPMYPDTPSHWFREFLTRHGLPHMRFHALRHLSATVLIAQGVPLKSVSARLGHADIRTTANIYSEALQSVDRQAASKMDEFLRRNAKH